MLVSCSIHSKCFRNPEEDDAIKSIINLYQPNPVHLSDIKCEPFGQSTPPDYAFALGKRDRDIAFEVRFSDIGFVTDKNGKISKISSIFPPVQSVIKNYLKQQIIQWLGDNDTIVLVLEFDSKMKRKTYLGFGSLLNQELKKLYQNKILSSEYTNIEIENGPIASVKLANYKNLPLISMLMPNSRLVSLKNQAFAILYECVKEKDGKMQNLSFEAKWLAIVNNHPLLDLDDYKEAYREIDWSKFCFSKVFIIFNGVAHELDQSFEN